MITAEKLIEIESVCSRMREIRKALESVYYAYTSPRFDSVKTTSPVKDPVTEAVNHALRLHEELDELLQIRQNFEDELQQVTDCEVCAIIRWHYCMGLSWKDTSWKVYHSRSYFQSRDKLRWYLTTPHHEPKENT